MHVVKRSAGVIYPETGDRFLALDIDMGASTPIVCTLYPRVTRDGTIYAVPAQKGCAVGCSFCSVPKIAGNLTVDEILQIMRLLEANASEAGVMLGGRNKICFVKGGELFQNSECGDILEMVRDEKLDVKISTVFPDTRLGRENIKLFMAFCESYPVSKSIGLQYSALSGIEGLRLATTKYPLMSFDDVRKIGKQFFDLRGRKVTVSFTATDDLHCQPCELADTLPPEYFAIRMYPYKQNAKHMTPMDDGRLLSLEREFSEFGYSVIPCLNQYERTIGYFDNSNETLKLFSF